MVYFERFRVLWLYGKSEQILWFSVCLLVGNSCDKVYAYSSY